MHTPKISITHLILTIIVLAAMFLPQTVLADGPPDGDIPAGLTAAEWESIQASVAEAEYRFDYRAESDTYHAPNRAHGWQTSFDTEGVRVTPGEGNWTWSLRLIGYGYQDLSGLAPVMSAEGDTLTYQWDANLSEW